MKAEDVMPAPRKPLVYEGATTIGFHILPDIAPLHACLGGSFGAIGDRGTNKGLDAVRAGRADVAGVARDLTPAERDEFFWALICHDALGVFVNAANPVPGLSRAQLKGIFTGRIRRWREVGGSGLEMDPVTEVKAGGRGTVQELRRIALDGDEYGPTREFDDAPDCLRDVAAKPAGITVASMAMAIPGARAIAIDGVEPTPDRVRSGAYLLGRPMFVVSRKPPIDDVRVLFEVLLSPEGQAVLARKFTSAR
jgi:phosphate transport system substrate-binding protein